MNYTIEKISGIDCIFAPMNDSNSTTIQIMCRAGSIYETPEINGIAHFIEHNFFKWWERYTTPKAVAEALDRIWWAFNAWTGDRSVAYYVKSAPQFTQQALDVLADMMMNAKFSVPELEREKWVVIQELKMYEDEPRALVMEKWQNRYYWDNNYGQSTIWTVETIQSFTQDALFSYRNALYTKDNLIIVIAGKILDIEKVKKLISDYFSALPPTQSIQKPTFPSFTPLDNKSFFDKKTEQNHLIISAKWIKWTDKQYYAADLLAGILGWNMSSRLFQNIREKQGLCYYIRASHYENTDTGDFVIRAGIDKERFEFWLDKIFEEIAKLASGDITDTEYDNIQWNIQWSLQMGIETSSSMADFLWNQYLEYGKIETLDEILTNYKKIKKSDIIELSQLLTRDKLFLYWIQ